MPQLPVVNIGQKQRTTRKALGYFTLLLAVVAAMYTIINAVSVWFLLLVFILLQNGVFLILEGKRGVCPVNAIRERRSMTGWFSFGQEPVEDPQAAAQLKKAANEMMLQSLLWAVGGLIVVMAIKALI